MGEIGSRILRASAGTGKTYQLVESYAGLVLDEGLRPGEIIAITFTRKAAAELRSRIRERLRHSHCDAERLAELDEAPIGNFHGLALQLLRGLGGSDGIGDGVDLLGESGEDAALFESACEEAWFGGDAEVQAALAEVAGSFSVERLAGELWDAIALGREDAATIDGAALLGRYDVDAVEQAARASLGGLQASVAAGRADLSAKGQASADAFLAAAAAIPDGPRRAWADGWRVALGRLDLRTAVRKLCSKDERDAAVASVLAVLAEERCASVAPTLARLFDAAWTRYRDLKGRRRWLDFADVVERLVEALAHDAALQRRLRERYRVVFVDEAQDTNRLQRRMIHLLAGLEGADGPVASPTPLWLVGDRKQAIYTFRGADPESFELFASDVERLGGRLENLATSYRSTAAVVRGVNHLGGHLFPAGYEALEARDGGDAEGDSALRWISVASEEGGRLVRTAREADALAIYVQEQLEAGRTPGDFALLLRTMTYAPIYAAALQARRIPVVIGGGAGLYEQSEVRDLAALVSFVCDAEDRLSAAVALRSPLVGLSDSALYALFGERGESARRLAALRRGEVPELGPGPAPDGPTLAWLAPRLAQLVEAATGASPSELVAAAIERLDLRSLVVALPAGEQRLANIDRLLEVAADFEQRRLGGARSFARFLRQRIERGHQEPLAMPPQGSGRALIVSTIHAAKGLEFEEVLLADLERRRRPEASSLRYVRGRGVVIRPRGADGEKLTSARWAQAAEVASAVEDDEERRLLYVAVTRARRGLTLIGMPPGDKSRGVLGGLLAPWRDEALSDGGLLELRMPEGVPAPPLPAARPIERATLDAWVASTAPAPLPPASRIELPVTSLETYLQCLRRGQLVRDLRLEEPSRPGVTPPEAVEPPSDPPLDPLTRGRLAHTLLAGMERLAGPEDVERFIDAELTALGYDPVDTRVANVRADVARFLDAALGRDLWALGTEARRHELPFRLRLDAAPYELELRGQLDLLYWDADGPVIVDFKHARAHPQAIATYGLQLDAYAVAVAELAGVSGSIRTRLLFLRGEPEAHEHLVTRARRDAFVAQAKDVVQSFAVWRGRRALWPGRERSVCEGLACGFVGRCHPSVA